MTHKPDTGYDTRLCSCGHRIQTHMHNTTGEMFGTTIGRCARCPCKQWEPQELLPFEEKKEE